MTTTEAVVCAWFARCTRPAAVVVSHPVLGEVPACAQCADRFTLWERAVRFLPCPACGADPQHDDCGHHWCTKHQVYTETVDEHTVSGFAGGTIWFVTYACGCSDGDDSDDVRAAR